MFWKKKKPVCDHDWHMLKSGEEYIDYITHGIPDGYYRDVAHIYCPKCDTRKRVSADEGELIIKANEIKKNYKQ